MDDTQSNDNTLFHKSDDQDSSVSEETRTLDEKDVKPNFFSSFMRDNSSGSSSGLKNAFGSKLPVSSSDDNGPKLYSSYADPKDASKASGSEVLRSFSSEPAANKLQFFHLDDENEIPEVVPAKSPFVPYSAPVNEQESTNQSAVDSHALDFPNTDTTPIGAAESAVQDVSTVTEAGPFAEVTTSAEVEPPVVEPPVKDASDVLTDSSFPLFLSFKANDNFSSVSDAIRDRNVKPQEPKISSIPMKDAAAADAKEPINPSIASDDPLEELSDFDIDHEALSRPIFKPAPTTVSGSSASTLDFPDVFNGHATNEVKEDKPDVSDDKSVELKVEEITPSTLTDDELRPIFVPFKPNTNANQDVRTVSEELPVIKPFIPVPSDKESGKPLERPGSKDSLSDFSGTKEKTERPGSKDRHQYEKTNARPGAHETKQEVRKEHAIKTGHTTPPEQPEPSAASTVIAASERISGNRYSAAQQMGTISPLARRDVKSKRRSNALAPILFAVLAVALIIGAFTLWTFFDFGAVLFGRNSEPSARSNGTAAVVTTFASETSASVAETNEATTEASTDTTTEAATEATTKATTESTTDATTKATTEATTAATTAETTKETTTAQTTQATTAASGSSAMIPASFYTTISDGKSSGDSASFNINFKNTGSKSVSLLDGIKQMTITLTTDANITTVTSDDFVFTPKEGKSNVFIGVPVSSDAIDKGDIVPVNVSLTSDGDTVGKFSVKYYVEFYS